NMIQILTALQTAIPEEVFVTIPEGYTIKKTAAALDAGGLIKGSDYMALAVRGQLDYDFLKDLPPGASLEGFLFPDTYLVPRNGTAKDLIKLQLDNFKRLWDDTRKSETAQRKLSPLQIVTIASMIEREARYQDDPPPRLTATTPRPSKSSPASSSSTASSKGQTRLLLLGGEGDGEPAASLFNAGFAAAGIDARCEVRAVAPAELPEAIARMRADRGILGAAVTMPHTVAASRLLDGLGPEAQVIRAVNTISHRAGALIGWNTDRSGFAQALDDAGFQAKGRSALVLGAGGAARASVDALRETA